MASLRRRLLLPSAAAVQRAYAAKRKRVIAPSLSRTLHTQAPAALHAALSAACAVKC